MPTKIAVRWLDPFHSFKRSAGVDGVLVSVESLTSLKLAYPNYFFLDTGVFIRAVEQAIA